MSTVHKFLIGLMWVFAALLVSDAARAERIRELASIAGVRNNQLVGYGIVVGLDGTGENLPFTTQSMINMLSRMGVTLPPGQSMQMKNVAAVMVTTDLPPFARVGQPIDVTVSSVGSAKSLRGGTLVMTPLKGADGNVYAMAQGNVVVVGAGAEGAGTKTTINHLGVGRIANGATVEREVPMTVGQGEFANVELRRTDFGTAQRVVDAINKAMGAGTASAIDGRQVKVRMPANAAEHVAFLGMVENLQQQWQLLIDNIAKGDVKTFNAPNFPSGEIRGVGFHEAPRGILIHHYKVDDQGAIKWANLIIATGHNNLAIGRSIDQASRHFVKANKLQEGMLNRVSAVVRAYDPCLSCSTHAQGIVPMQIELVSPDGTVLDSLSSDC